MQEHTLLQVVLLKEGTEGGAGEAVGKKRQHQILEGLPGIDSRAHVGCRHMPMAHGSLTAGAWGLPRGSQRSHRTLFLQHQTLPPASLLASRPQERHSAVDQGS